MPSLRAPDQAPDIVTAFQHLYVNNLYSDFLIISRDGSEKHQVHKLVLAIHSPELAKMLYGDKPIKFLQIKSDVNLAVRNMVRFFYNEELVLENVSDIRHTKTIADRFKIAELVNYCKDELINVPVTIPDVLTILETAKEFKNEEKENECYRLIGQNQEEIFTSRQFLGMPFRIILSIFEKNKCMNMMTEVTLLQSALRWMDTNGNFDYKELLKEKVDIHGFSLNDYLDIIIDYPDFFSNIEISLAVKEIKSRSVIPDEPKISVLIADNKEHNICEKRTEVKKSDGNYVELEDKKDVEKEELLANVNFFKEELDSSLKNFHECEQKYDLMLIELQEKKLDIQSKNKKIDELELLLKNLREKKEQLSRTTSISQPSKNKQKKLIIQMLNQEDGINIFDLQKRARITVQDGNTIRSLQVSVDDVLKKGLIGTVAEKKGNYSESDLDINYEGVYFMLRSLKEFDNTLSPIQYIQVLKAVLHFQIKELAEKCIKRISGIADYDPLFLDGLRALSYLKDKCLGLKGLSKFEDQYIALLLSEPLRVILHPNFTNCSVDLIVLLLQQSELKVKDESQLLLVVISWLEARADERRIFRTTLLKNIAFQNLSTADFKYTTVHYPNFFNEKEQKLVLAFRNAVGSELKFFRDNLPEWYSFKTRKLI